ncbi:MAG: CinA family protein [Paracoccaceae bacterium]
MSDAATILSLAREKDVMIATAESCTGGMVAAALTDIPGSSDVFDRGFVTYSNAAKAEMLGVDPALIALRGAVSSEVAAAMAIGALAASKASLAVSVTGIAGPGGGSAEKPEGLVWFGLAQSGRPAQSFRKNFEPSGRGAVRLAARNFALSLLHEALGG